MRKHLRIATLAAPLLVGCASQRVNKDAPPPTTQPSSKLYQLHERLAVRLPRSTFSGASLADVIQHLRDASGANLFVNWRATEMERVTKDLPVTLDLTGLTLAEAVTRLLDHVGGETVRLGYTLDDDVITISTRRDLARNTMTRVYDVRAAVADPGTWHEDLNNLVRRLQGLAPLSWRERGGDVGAIRELHGQLIVTQTPEMHRKIADELGALIPKEKATFPVLSRRSR